MGMFGRIGTTAVLNQQITDAKKVGAVIEKDLQAGTIRASLKEGGLLFRAIRKDTNTWIVMYNSVFYQRT